jgi:hypothetical protein
VILSSPGLCSISFSVSQEIGESLHGIQRCNKLRTRNQCNNGLKLSSQASGWLAKINANIQEQEKMAKGLTKLLLFLSHKLQQFAIYRRRHAQVSSTSVSGSLGRKCTYFSQCTKNVVEFPHERYKTKQIGTRY